MIPIPQEIVDIILYNLCSDPVALRSCSLVCSSWVHSSRSHLFHRIVLSPPRFCPSYERRPEDASDSQRLHMLLLEAPHISTYVKQLKIYEGQATNLESWIKSDSSLPLVLRMLTSLTRLELRRLKWNQLQLDLRQSLYAVLELPSLTYLEIKRSHFSSIGDFNRLLSHAKSLTVLSLISVSTLYFPPDAWTDAIEQDASSRPRGRLLALGLDVPDCTVIVDLLLGPESPFDMSYIRTLHISQISVTSAINRLLYAAGSSLERLKLGVTGSNSLVNIIDIGRNPNINHLHLAELEAQWNVNFLSDLGGLSRLEDIKFDVGSPYFLDERVDWTCWETVDTVLAGNNFKFLRNVYIRLRMSDERWFENHEKLVRALPLLRAKEVEVHIYR